MMRKTMNMAFIFMGFAIMAIIFVQFIVEDDAVSNYYSLPIAVIGATLFLAGYIGQSLLATKE